jgi:hypothetical protein
MRRKVLCDVKCFFLVYLLLSGAFCAFAIKLVARQTACKRMSFSTKCITLLALILLCFLVLFFLRFKPGCLHVWNRRCGVRFLSAAQFFPILSGCHQCQRGVQLSLQLRGRN